MHPAIEWLVDVMTRSHNWADDKVIRIDHPQIKDLPRPQVKQEKLFSWNDLSTWIGWKLREKLDHQTRAGIGGEPTKMAMLSRTAVIDLQPAPAGLLSLAANRCDEQRELDTAEQSQRRPERRSKEFAQRW